MNKTDWFMKSGWGVCMHFAASKHGGGIEEEEFHSYVERFDVEALADQLEAVGAGYLLITSIHGSEHVIAPNSAYDSLCEFQPGERCARRDLPLELSEALEEKNIRLMLYFPTNPRTGLREKIGWDMHKTIPSQESLPKEHHKDLKKGVPTRQSMENWASVIREFSERYKTGLAGWWFDTARKELYDNHLDQNHEFLGLMADAARAGNPDSLVAFNPGANLNDFTPWTGHEDYIAGHDKGKEQLKWLPETRFVNGVQWHTLVFMGYDWGARGERFSWRQWADYLNQVLSKQGVVTFDVGKNLGNEGKIGTICDQHMEQLMRIKDSLP